MASGKPKLAVILSPSAREELRKIYVYDAKHKSVGQANRYQDFLTTGVEQLATAYDEGDEVDGFPDLRRIALRPGRSRWSDGHYVIYEIDEAGSAVYVHHFYHTTMDVQGRLRREL
jgi:plasmid stabilization system protein ParE